MISQIEKKVLDHERLDSKDALFLLNEAPLVWLGQLAAEVRHRKNPDPCVTFVLDTNPNYTNICDTYCHFCAFYRRSTDSDAYTLSLNEVMAKIDRAVRLGATTVLLQGGHNKELPLEYYLSLVRETRRRFPQITPHFFTASEIQTMAQVAQLPIRVVLEKLKAAGQFSLPGGGAEILSDRVRKKISPLKGGPVAWLDVHREAHKLGFISTATMMFGHVEEPVDIVTHWDLIRALQDESLNRNNGGFFTAFIPWSFKPENTVMKQTGKKRIGSVLYLRILAASRLYLDNFQHIQASWFSEGQKMGQVALLFGADDFGGTLYEENVHAEAGFINTSTVEEIVTLIHEAGFDALQRNTRYEPIHIFKRGENTFHASAETEQSVRKNEFIDSFPSGA